MSGLIERLPSPRLPLPRRAHRPRPLTVDGHPSPLQRAAGLGSVFGKGIRDGRRGMLLGGLGLGLLVVFTASQVFAEFGTAAARAQMAALPQQLPPVFRGMLGRPINVETLGGFLSWRTVNIVPLLLGAWSVAALSGTLAGEARRGTLDLILATPHGRLAVALQKAGAHVVTLAVASLLLAASLWLSGRLFASLPGDEIGAGAALGHGGWLLAMALLPGSIAWAVAPVVGRGAAAGLGAAVMIVSFVVTGYRESLPVFAAIDGLSAFSWTAAHRPIAGAWDWAPVAGLAALDAGLLLAGAVLFRVRDVGITKSVGIALPRLRMGLGGPFGRSFADRLPVAGWWGIGLGLLGFVYAANAEAFAEALRAIPQVEQILGQFFPGVDLFTAGGILQLVFFGFGSVMIAVAAAMLASGWASDEAEGRLELVLSAPLRRARWALASAGGVLASIVVLTAVMGLLLAAGVLASGDPVRDPLIGAGVLGLYAMALAGIGMAVGGLVRSTLAASVAGSLGVAFYLLDTLGAALNLPAWVLDLSLTRQLGRPMAGDLDPVGVVACAVLAVAGVALCTVGLARRDISR